MEKLGDVIVASIHFLMRCFDVGFVSFVFKSVHSGFF